VDPVAVAKAMSGVKFQGTSGEMEMRRTDHQTQQQMFITEWSKANAKFPYSVENTGWNFQPVRTLPSFVASTPTSCQMKRP
jgi:branched-chain amino acid transport system substrate-binding protein